jgi:hypothetical protein
MPQGLKELKALHAKSKIEEALALAKTLDGDPVRIIEAALHLEKRHTLEALASLNKVADASRTDDYFYLRSAACSHLGLVQESDESLSRITVKRPGLLSVELENAIASRNIAFLTRIANSSASSEGANLAKLRALNVLGDYSALLRESDKFSKEYPEAVSGWVFLQEHRNLSDSEEAQILKTVDTASSTLGKVILLNTLGKSRIAKGDVRGGTAHIVNSNLLAAAENPYDLNYSNKQYDVLVNIQTAPASEPQQLLQPIFIVGMPRSGTTLLEKLFLDAGYDSVGECLLIHTLIQISLIKNKRLDPDFMRRSYINNIAYRGVESTTWVDKSLDNYKYIPVIKEMFPNAKFVLVCRDPKANFWSIYKTVFRNGNLFANDFSWIKAEYQLLQRYLAPHQNHITQLDYIDLVSGRFQIPSIGEALDRPMATASAGLVRKPLDPNRNSEIDLVEPELSRLGVTIFS